MSSSPRNPFHPQVIRDAVSHLQRNDRILSEVIDAVGPFQLKRQTRRFESLARAIIAQQVSTAAARSIWGKLLTRLPNGRVTAETLREVPDEDLRSAGISPQKLVYLRDLQERSLSGQSRLASLHRYSDEEVIARLTRIKGIGVWTAQMFLMFSLGRLDVLPHHDLGIRSAIRRLYALDELPDRERTELISTPWRPFATVACWYLWRSSELETATRTAKA